MDSVQLSAGGAEWTTGDVGPGRSSASPLLIEAKLEIPVPRREAIHRPGVAELLNGDQLPRIVAVIAPGGLGKTTAIASWLASAAADGAWLTCDADDGDAVRFLAHLLAAIGRVAPGAVVEAERALAGGAGLREQVLPLLANGLYRAKRRIVIVLDDVHLLSGSATPAMIERLIALAPTVTVVLIGRREPELPLARWMAAGEVTWLGPEQLRFSPEETDRFLNGSMRLGLSPEELALIGSRVEGWAAGLSLVAMSLGTDTGRKRLSQTLQGTSGSISTYLLQETLGVLDDATREFMIRSSVLRRLNADVCAAVLGDQRTHELIDEIRRSNLLVADVDERGEWFRYHQLLSETLREQLRRQHPGLTGELHRRASAWFESAGYPAEAIDHALDAGDGQRAARLLSDSWLALCNARRGRTVSRILERLPDDVGPYGPAIQCIALFVRSLVTGAGPDIWQESAELERIEREQDPPGLARVLDAAYLAPLHGNFAAGLARGPAAMRRAESALPVDRYALTVQYGALLWLAGDPGAAREVLDNAQYVPGSMASEVWELFARSGIALDDADIECAVRHGEAAVAHVRAAGSRAVNVLAPALQACATALLYAGRLDEADACLREAEGAVRPERDPMHHLPNVILRAQLHLATAEWSAARSTAAEARRLVDSFVDVGVYDTRLRAVEQALQAPLGLPPGAAVPEPSDTGERLVAEAPTAAELRVLRLLATGMSVTQVAEELYVSANTVRSHRRRLYRRLGVNSRDDALRVAHERALI